MGYIQTGSGLKGLARVRYENGDRFVAPTTQPLLPPIAPIPAIQPAEAPSIPSGWVGGPDTVPFFLRPIPIAPSFEVDDTKFGPVPIPPTMPTEIRSTAVSVPVPAADSKLAFELAEAQKWDFTHARWMAMGSGARCRIRSKYPEGYKPVTPSGTTIAAARVDLIEGRDPLRSMENYSGAGDHAGGIEIREPLPSVPLIATKSGITFDDIVWIDPTKVQTTAEAAGVTAGEFATPEYIRYGVLAFAGWVLYDMFFKKKKAVKRRRPARAMRRQYPYASRKRHIRQGQQ